MSTATEETTMTAKTNGQQFTDTLRDVMSIGTRTRRHRKHPLVAGKQNVISEALETVITSNNYPGYYSEPTSRALGFGWSAVCSWNKHVEGYRIDSTQRAYLTSLSPWQFAALLGEMVDAGVANVADGERWFAARRAADVAAWESRVVA